MRWFFRKRSASKAKERLQLVLIHDRTDLTADELSVLQDEILQAITRHVDVDSERVRFSVEHDGRSQRLVADIPLRSVTRRRAG